MPETSLVILGAGGYGRALAEVASSLNKWSNIYFIDDLWPKLTHVNGYDVIGNIEALSTIDTRDFVGIAAIGDNLLREQWQVKLKHLNIPLATIVHDTAIISPSAQISSGVSIMAGCIVSASCHLHEGVILNIGSLLDHDVVVGHYSHLSVGVKVVGGQCIKPHTYFNIGTCISN